MDEKKGSNELWKYFKEIAMRPDKAAADTAYFAGAVAISCNPCTPKLAQCKNARNGELDRSQQKRRK